MTSPYQLLGANESATDAEIKQAYLQQVKLNPPDRDQQRFQQIQQAYEAIKDSDSRLRYGLFEWPEADFDSLLQQAFQPSKVFKPLSTQDFCKLLHEVAVEKALANALITQSS